MQSPINFWMLSGVIAAGLLLFAGAIILHVLAAAPGRRPSWSETFAWARGLLWALPVLAVTGLVVGRAAPRFQELQAAQAEVPEQVQIELNESEGLTVEEDGGIEAATPEAAQRKSGKGRRLVTAVKDKVGQVLGKESAPEATTDASGLPDWVSQPATKEGDRTLLVLASREHPTVADAEKELAAIAASRVRADFEQTHPANVDWTIPPDAVKFGLRFEEKIARQAGNVSFTMFKVHRQLELSGETRQAAFQAFRAEVVRQRLWALGMVLGMGVLIAAGSSVYLRLDARTNGQYRTRLKAATVAGLTAGGLLLTAGLSMGPPLFLG
jgi:hypothetical protein